jgi:hypothetical protein
VKPIDLNFKPSFILSALLLSMSVMSSWLVCIVPLSFTMQCLSLLLIWLAAIYVMAGDALLLLPWSPVALHVNTKNQLNIITKDGQRLIDVSLSGDSIVTPWLTIVQFKPKGATYLQRLLSRPLLILPDSTDAQNLRRLRVWMRWGQRDKVR